MKYKLSIKARYALQERHIEDIELDTIHNADWIRFKELSVLNPEAFLSFSLNEIEEKEVEEETD